MKKIKIFLLSLTILLFVSEPAKATNINELGDTLNDDNMSQEQFIIGNTEQVGLMDSINYSLYCNIAGCRDTAGTLAKGGMVPQLSKFMAFMYTNPPASSNEYFADILDNIGVPTVQKARAQGVGYDMLRPMLNMWKAMRNLTYSIYIILFAVIGLMIIFRTKVNAQTIVTIQTALPNLIITLILITFSYAIAGFLIDLMYFSFYFVAYIAQANNLVGNAGNVIEHLTNKSAFSMIFVDSDNRQVFLSNAANSISGILGDLLGDGEGKLENFIENIAWGSLAHVVVAAALAIQMLKLMWSLTRSYVMILVQTVTAPLQILPNAIPGSTSFTTWLKKTFSYVAPFPVVAAMFIFAAILIGQNDDVYKDGDENPFGVTITATGGETISYPPFIGSGSGLNSNQFLGLIGFFIVLMTPAAAKSVQEALQVKENMFTSEIAAGVQAGVWPIKGGFGAIQRRREERRQRSMYSEIGKAMKDDTAPKS